MRSAAPFILPFIILSAVPAIAAEAVPVANFRSVELRGGGDIVISAGAEQRVTIVEGSSQVTTFRVNRQGELEIDACNNRCPRNYRLRVEIVSPRAPDAAITGGGRIRFSGGFPASGDLAVAINGGGQIDARAVSATNVSAAVNGGGSVLTGASRHLSAAINGGGEVRYAGNPHVSSAIHGGGVVRPAN